MIKYRGGNDFRRRTRLGTDVIDYSRTVSQSHGPFTNATPTIEIAPTTTESATAKSTEPSLPVADIENTGCKCNLKTVWLDIFLLMEASLSMTENGITSATDYVVSALTKLTIGQAEQFQTRFGVIRYASSVELIADLNTLYFESRPVRLEHIGVERNRHEYRGVS
ncbi:hypothetical protein COOONC_07654 [Cooperia oncophora]